ncbi:MAG: hypothetical protein EXS17_01355 [Phycisphaerales bacterium]|nr:hypothetical protein [Phycisphaerales bacterium]
MRHPPLDRLRVVVLAVGVAAAIAGCSPQLRSGDVALGVKPAPPTTTMPLEGTDAHVRFRLEPLCSIDYDGFSLPLVSPDGQWAAVQASSTADWPTLLAALDGGQPNAGTLSIVSLALASTYAPIAVNGPDLLLGRSADDAGFLVESPRIDGARWIGRVAWDGRDPIWLIEGDDVNALATLGDGDSIAWCRRACGSAQFGLCIRQAGVTQEIPPPEDGSWMAPLFSNDGKYLYALRLRDGVLAACAFPISQAMSTVPTVAIDLSWRADARSAYQMLVPLRTGGLPSDGRLWFFHPRFGRMAVWNPVNNRVAMASSKSAAAAMISGGRLVTASAEHLSAEPMPVDGSATEPKRTSTILDALWIPIWRGGTSTLLVVHPHDGRLDVARVDLDPGKPESPLK